MPRKLFCVGQFCKKPNVALLQATICGKTLAMATPSEIADAIGRKKLAEALEVGRTAIGNAVDRGTFPSSWYLVVKALADEVGVECPASAFAMREYRCP